jgi:hypothetical protein
MNPDELTGATTRRGRLASAKLGSTPIVYDHCMNPLTGSDFDLIFESLRYTRKALENYDKYPDEDFRRAQIERVDTAVEHLRQLEKG